MKFKEIMIVTLILLTIFSITAVSATDDVLSADDNADSVSAVNREIYVDSAGSDTGSGSQSSPYATINKALSDVNSSDEAVIHLAAGTYSGEDNTNLEINLAHKNYNGSLTLIGAGNGLTIIDGGDEAQIIKSISADSLVTLINITFTHGRASQGSAISSSGDLTVDECIFQENHATSYATLYHNGNNDLTVKNSKFISNSAGEYTDIYFNQNRWITLLNNIFENSAVTDSYAYCASVYIDAGNSTIKGNTFKNLINSRYATALYARGYYGYVMNIIDNTFINCTYDGTSGGIVYTQNAYLKNNTFEGCAGVPIYLVTDGNAYVSVDDVEITGTHFVLSANVTDDMGNKIQGAKVQFYLDGNKIGDATSNADGYASVSVDKLLENGQYIINATQSYDNDNPFDVTVRQGTATVDFDHSPVDLWVSPEGDDTTGDGSENNPFLTLKHALDYGVDNSVDITVHMKEGIYNETGDYDLSYSNVAKITIVGESYGKSVIDALNAHRFFTSGINLELLFRNVTFINGAGTSSRSFDVRHLTMEDCIVNNSKKFYAQTSPSYIVFKNVTWINSENLMMYNPEIYNSHFENITSTGTGNLWMTTSSKDIPVIIENSTFINLRTTGSSGAGVAYVQANFISINNVYDSCSATKSYGALYAYGNNILSMNDTFINNNATNYGAAFFGSGSSEGSVMLINDKFINNFASGNGSALGIYGGEIINCTFENNVAGANGGAIYLSDHSSSVSLYDLELKNVTFKNNTADNGRDIFIAPTTSTSKIHSNLKGMNVTFNNKLINTLQDTVSADVTHESGANIGGSAVTFYVDGSYIGVANVVNGTATLDYLGFSKNGTYTLSGDYGSDTSDTRYKNARIIVLFNPLKENVTLYVSDSRGDDSEGDGSFENPYKTIETALTNGYKQSSVVVVKVLEGIYTGELNTNITVFSSMDVSIIGEGQNKTIIDGRDLDWFLNIKAGQGIVRIADMTIANITKNYVDAKLYNQMPAITIEKTATVSIDNVTFMRCHGTEGGAILSNGSLIINNTYFFNNGDSNYGAAIKNYGTAVIYSTVFRANHAKYYSTIYNDGNLYLFDSLIEDAMRVNGFTGNAIVIGGSGNITMVNSTILRTGKTCDEIIGANQTWANNPGFVMAIASTGDIKVYNSTFDGNNRAYTAQYVTNAAFLGSGSLGISSPYGLQVVDTRILNLRMIVSNSNGTKLFDSCYIENVTSVCEGTSYACNITVVNSYFADGTINVTKKADSNVTLNNNWWGNNSQPTYKVSNADTNPDTWLILTLNATNNTGLVQDAILEFKVFDGENITDYDGSLYPREFTIDGENVTLDSSNGTITNKVNVPFKGTKNCGYYLEATVDGQTVNLTVDDKLDIGNATIIAEDISLMYGENQINVTVLSGEELVNIGNVELIVNKKKYTAGVINGTATFDIDVLNPGNYTLKYSFSAPDSYNPTTNSSALSVNLPELVTNSTFFYFFDEEGNLKDYVTGDLTFEGEFENLGVDKLIINAPIKLNGNNATLTNIGIEIAAQNVTVDGFNFISDELDEVIYVEEDNAVITNNNFNVTAPEDEDSYVIHVDGADGVEISENVISYASDNSEGTLNRVIAAEDSDNLNVSDNIIDAEMPAVVINYTTNTVPSIGLSFDGCDNLTLENNLICVESDDEGDGYDTVYAVDIDGDNAVVKDNGIIVGDAPYNYGLVVSGEDFIIEGNNISAGNDDVYACGIEIDGPSSGIVEDNVIDVESDSAYGVYSSDWSGDVSVDYIGNDIRVDGVTAFGLSLSGDDSNVSDNTIIAEGNYTTGIASMVEDILIDNNNITANGSDTGTPAGYDMMGIETTGIHIAAGNATITDNAVLTTGEYAIDDKGTGSVINNNLVARNYTGDASMDYRAGDVISLNNTPAMYKAVLSSEDIVKYYKNGTRYVVILTDRQGNPLSGKNVTLSVNGMNYIRPTKEDGSASIPLNLAPGNYTLFASFDGDENCTSANITNNLTVLSTVSGDNIVKYYRNGTQYYASFTDANGNPLVNGTVSFNINGVTYTRHTNENGTAKLNINLPAGKYIVTACNAEINNQTFSNNITVLSTIEGKDIVKYYKNDTQYYAKFLDDNGNPIANQLVKFNINGKIYNRRTDENGTAKMNINLPAGNYTITAINPFNNETGSNNIEVLPTLSANNLTKVYGSSDKFVAHVVDGQGNALSGVQVKFNINGVYYTRTTDSNGDAKLNINLPKGEYIITSTYDGANVANKVTVTA